MVNFDFEKMLNEGLNKDEIWKKFEAEIKNAQSRLDEKKKAEEEKKKKEEITEAKRKAAISALRTYFNDVGYDNVEIYLDKNSVRVRLEREEEKPSEEKADEQLKKISERMKEYKEYESSNNLSSVMKDYLDTLGFKWLG